jgi:multidrug efflux system outer membrane protein
MFAARLARVRYQSGTISYLEVLTTDSNLLFRATESRRFTGGEEQSLVLLYEALGAGWE